MKLLATAVGDHLEPPCETSQIDRLGSLGDGPVVEQIGPLETSAAHRPTGYLTALASRLVQVDLVAQDQAHGR